MDMIKTTLNFVDSEKDCAHFTYLTCSCGCGSVGSIFYLESSLLDEPIAIERNDASGDIDPLLVASDMIDIFESDFHLDSIDSEIVEMEGA